MNLVGQQHVIDIFTTLVERRHEIFFQKIEKKLLDNKNISVPGFSEIASKIYLNSGQK